MNGLSRWANAVSAAGTRTLVTGDEEASIALFRATAGLWDSGEGRIVRPSSDEVLFLTERPYLSPGTLRQALVRTGREQDVADARILDVLRELGMDGALEKVGGLDVERDWHELLSLGEQQMLSLARLALAAPRYAVLDRPETVLGAEVVSRALDLLAEQRRPPVAGREETSQNLHRRRLAAPIGPEEPEDLPPLDAEVDPVHCDEVAESLGQVDRLNGYLAAGRGAGRDHHLAVSAANLLRQE